MRTLAIHSHHVRCLAYSPDGSLLATASNDRSVRLLDAATGKTVKSWPRLGGVMQAVAFSPDGTRLAFGGQIENVFSDGWGPGDSHVQSVAVARPYSSHVTCLAYTPDGKTILCGAGDRILRVPGRLIVLDDDPISVRVWHGERHGVQHIAMRPDGKQAAIGHGHGWHFVSPPRWDAGTGFVGGTTAPALAYSPDGALLAVAKGFAIELTRPPAGVALRELAGHRGRVTSLAFTLDGRKVVSGSWDRTVRIWDVASGREESALEWGRGKVQYVAAAPDGMTAAAACDKGVVIWDLDT